jgi:hypothetical protein
LKQKSAIAAIFLLTVFLLSVRIPARPPEVIKYFSQADEEIFSGKYDKDNKTIKKIFSYHKSHQRRA